MTKTISAAIIAAAVPATAAAIPADPALEARVDSCLATLTLDEKIGQMTQLTIDVLGEFGSDGVFRLVPEKMDAAFRQHKVGSILNAPGVRALTPERWYEIISEIQLYSLKYIKVPSIYGLDQNHGATYDLGATMLPQNIGMGATFNPGLVRRGAAMTAYETRAADCPWTFSPTLDLGRDPRWPRIWEDYGEDALLNSVMGVAAVRGFQGDDPNRVGPLNIAACLKHYMGYGVPVSGQDRTPALISESDLRDKHFAPYLAAIRAGALSLMVNSSSINGEPVHASYRLLTKWLKEDLHWDGLIVTDWADINNLYTREMVAEDKKEAIAMAINAGIDMSMEPYDTDFCTLLHELVDEGTVPLSRIDDAVRRVLRLKMRLGLFDRPNTVPADYPLFGCAEHRAIAREAAVQSMVLLKNEGDILPLAPGRRILVTGPNANSQRCLNGGWTYSWQGRLREGDFDDCNTLVMALARRFGEDYVNYSPGVTYVDEADDWQTEDASYIADAVAAARDADIIIACVGENSYCETPGNIKEPALSENQRRLVRELASTGKPIVLILSEGRPRLIGDIEPLAAAVVDIMLPGMTGGEALAALLAGDENFSGRLPFTYPRHSGALSTYDYKVAAVSETMPGAYDYSASVSVQWPFGFGRSYTTFRYSDARVDRAEFGPDDTLTFSVDVSNTGQRAGMETVMLFTSDLVASRITPDNRRLRAFEKISLEPGETRRVTLKIPASDLAYVDASGAWILERGAFRATIGSQTLDLRCTETRVYPGPNK